MKSNLPTIAPWKSILFSAILFFCALSPSYAADVTLEWDANTEPDVDGYKVYYDTDSGHPYDGTEADEGKSGEIEVDKNTTTITLHGLPDGQVYFFVVTAYDTEGLESDYSNEVFTPTVTFTSASQSQDEDSGNMTITCELSAASGLDVEIPFSVTGTAADPADYSVPASPVTISAGSTQTTITISVVADSMDEPDETVIVDMGTPTNATQGATTQHTATITDDDDPLDSDDDGIPDEWEIANGLNPLINDSDQDPDDDGLANIGEYQNGTDPNSSDTDTDGMPDGWEVTYGLDPLVDDASEDTDNDGYTNLQEYLYGTQPNDSDSNPQPPTADAGPDQTVDEGVTVTLDGSNSSDPDDGIHRYLWTQSVGTPVTLSDAAAVQPTFVTPPVDSNGTHLEFLLSVTDNGGLQHTDLVSIDVEDNGIIDFPSDVLPTESSTGENIGIIVESGGSIVAFVTVSPDSLPDTTDMPDDMIYGLIQMQLKPDREGGTVKVTVYLENPAPDGYVWYKYGPNNGWYDYSDHAVFNADRDQVTLTLVDGGIGDDDGVANGVILDPSGLGCTPTGYTTSGGSGCFIATAAFGSKMDRHVQVLSEFRDKWLANNHLGKRFVPLYNRFSPPIADFLRSHPFARAAVRYGLIPISGVAYVALYVHPGVLLFSFILLLLIGVYCFKHSSCQHSAFSNKRFRGR